MSEESHFQGKKQRPLRSEEKALLRALLDQPNEDFSNEIVEDMNDGRMGSVLFTKQEEDDGTALSKELAKAECTDIGGILVSIVINVDKDNNLHELDFWKVDFSPLR